MAVRLELLRGLDRLDATTAVLQRARLADPTGGVWEAADVQWWWRRPRVTDGLSLPVWFDHVGPVAAVGLTEWDRAWQADVHTVRSIVDIGDVWTAMITSAHEHDGGTVEFLVREDDDSLVALAMGSGFRAGGGRSGIAWMAAEDRPSVSDVPDGFVIADRATRRDRPHPMIPRNGERVEARLRECSLYEPTLDLSIEDPDGVVAGYALFWFDRLTGVGMLEPMRVEDRYRRRGLARSLLNEGLDRLAAKGARRLKVGFNGDAGRNLYLSAGFVQTATLQAFRRQVPGTTA